MSAQIAIVPLETAANAASVMFESPLLCCGARLGGLLDLNHTKIMGFLVFS
ncbi:MAG: hypothetical protein ABL894_10830 [Hyphomicrobium sp.]